MAQYRPSFEVNGCPRATTSFVGHRSRCLDGSATSGECGAGMAVGFFWGDGGAALPAAGTRGGPKKVGRFAAGGGGGGSRAGYAGCRRGYYGTGRYRDDGYYGRSRYDDRYRNDRYRDDRYRDGRDGCYDRDGRFHPYDDYIYEVPRRY